MSSFPNSGLVRVILRATALLTVGVLPLPAMAAGHAAKPDFAAIHGRAVEAARAFHARSPQADLTWQDDQAGVHMILDLDQPLLGETVAQRAESFLRANEALLGVPASQLRAVRTTTSRQRSVVHYQQFVTVAGHELRVLDGELTLTVDNTTGHLLRVVNSARPALDLVPGTLTRQDAVAKAAEASAGATFARGNASAAEEAVIANRTGARHVWIVHIPGASLRDLRTLAVDARTGAVARMPNRVLD